MEQQKQTVRYSFQFVDEQLTEIQKKLVDAENNLSNFKAGGEIMTIEGHASRAYGLLEFFRSRKITN